MLFNNITFPKISNPLIHPPEFTRQIGPSFGWFFEAFYMDFKKPQAQKIESLLKMPIRILSINPTCHRVFTGLDSWIKATYHEDSEEALEIRKSGETKKAGKPTYIERAGFFALTASMLFHPEGGFLAMDIRGLYKDLSQIKSAQDLTFSRALSILEHGVYLSSLIQPTQSILITSLALHMISLANEARNPIHQIYQSRNDKKGDHTVDLINLIGLSILLLRTTKRLHKHLV
jgi:hypothetical protein